MGATMGRGDELENPIKTVKYLDVQGHDLLIKIKKKMLIIP